MHRKKIQVTSNWKKSVDFEPSVYWFRDYWSNRLRLNRNINTEEFDIDTKSDFLPSELAIDKVAGDKCNVKWANGEITGLVEPFKLAKQYEPFSIGFPLNKNGIRNESPDPKHQIDSELARKVIATPLVQTSAEMKLWLGILLRVIIPSVLFLIIEVIVLRYAAILYPELAGFSLTIFMVSIALFLYFSLLTFVRGSISEGTRNIVGAKATVYFYHGQEPEKFHFRYSGDVPNWLESKPYWVFRYVYSWSFELAPNKGFPFIRAVKDIERLDVWLDAKTGIIEWIVSDYHWRELWYRSESSLAGVNVWVLRNFHTIRPLNISVADKGTLSDLYLKGKPLYKLWMDNLEKYKMSHSTYFQKNKSNKKLGDRLLFSNLTDLWWEKWRYKYGANEMVYENPVFAATGKQPSLSTPIFPSQRPITDAVTSTVSSSLKANTSSPVKVSVILSSRVPTTKPANAIKRSTLAEKSSSSSKGNHALLFTVIATTTILSAVLIISRRLTKKKTDR